MMNYRNIQLPSSRILEWGKQGENKATRLSVDVSEFIKLSEGTIAVSCCRPDGKKYPHDCTINDTTVEIELSSYDTQVCGILTIVVSWMCGERIVKSEIYCGEISRSISTSGEKPTPPFDGLIEQVCNAAIKAKESADRAEAAEDLAAETASAAREAAVDARASKQACGEILESVQSTVAEVGAVQVQAVKDKGAEVMDSVAAVGAEQVSAVQAVSDNSKTAIERKTDEQLARIPEVTELTEDVSSLKSEKLTEPAAGLAVGKYFRVAAIDENGHAVLEAVDAKTVGVQDVQVAGASVVADGVANVPIANEFEKTGVVRLSPSGGVKWSTDIGALAIDFATQREINDRASNNKPLIPYYLDYTVKAAMCDGKGAAWTSAEQKAARERMGVDKAYELIEEITLTEKVTQLIRNAEPNGTPYHFKKMYVNIITPQAEKDGIIYSMFNNTLIGLAMNCITSKWPEGGIAQIYANVVGGFLDGYGVGAANVSSSSNLMRYATLSNTPSGIAAIDSMKIKATVDIPINTNIKIYVVRA